MSLAVPGSSFTDQSQCAATCRHTLRGVPSNVVQTFSSPKGGTDETELVQHQDRWDVTEQMFCLVNTMSELQLQGILVELVRAVSCSHRLTGGILEAKGQIHCDLRTPSLPHEHVIEDPFVLGTKHVFRLINFLLNVQSSV